VHAFFDALGAERAARITHVSADGADWIAGVVAARAPQAVLCADPFHVVSWATGALDEVRREVWRTTRQAGATTPIRHLSRTVRLSSGDAKDLKHARYALWKNPQNLTGRQQAKLAWIEKPTPTSGAPTCSKKDYGCHSSSKAKKGNTPSPAGYRGPPAAASPNSRN
jgi:transposase